MHWEHEPTSSRVSAPRTALSRSRCGAPCAAAPATPPPPQGRVVNPPQKARAAASQRSGGPGRAGGGGATAAPQAPHNNARNCICKGGGADPGRLSSGGSGVIKYSKRLLEEEQRRKWPRGGGGSEAGAPAGGREGAMRGGLQPGAPPHPHSHPNAPLPGGSASGSHSPLCGGGGGGGGRPGGAAVAAEQEGGVGGGPPARIAIAAAPAAPTGGGGSCSGSGGACMAQAAPSAGAGGGRRRTPRAGAPIASGDPGGGAAAPRVTDSRSSLDARDASAPAPAPPPRAPRPSRGARREVESVAGLRPPPLGGSLSLSQPRSAKGAWTTPRSCCGAGPARPAPPLRQYSSRLPCRHRPGPALRRAARAEPRALRVGCRGAAPDLGCAALVTGRLQTGAGGLGPLYPPTPTPRITLPVSIRRRRVRPSPTRLFPARRAARRPGLASLPHPFELQERLSEVRHPELLQPFALPPQLAGRMVACPVWWGFRSARCRRGSCLHSLRCPGVPPPPPHTPGHLLAGPPRRETGRPRPPPCSLDSRARARLWGFLPAFGVL